jgi:uncharacterized protein YdeI (YjbR/CyaY-like superfamily)
LVRDQTAAKFLFNFYFIFISASWLPEYFLFCKCRKRNIGLVARLEKEEKLHPAGQKAIEAAKADGRWDSAYDSPGNMNVPDELMLELANVPESLAFFESLDKVNKYSFCWRIQSAKNQVTKEKRMKVIMEMLAKGEKLHP